MADGFTARAPGRSARLVAGLLLMSLWVGCGADNPDSAPDKATSTPSSTPTSRSPGADPHRSVLATINTGTGPITLTATNNAIWVELHREDRVARIDPTTNEQVETLDVPAHCQVLAAGNSVWAAIARQSLVTRFDPRTGRILQQFEIPDACGLAVEGRSVWVTSPGTGDIYRLVGGRKTIVEQHHVGPSIFGVLPAGDSFWITSEAEGGLLMRVNRETFEVTVAGKFPLIDNVLLAFGDLWVGARGSGLLWKLDLSTACVLDQVEVESPAGFVEAASLLWVTTLSGKLIALDPESLEVVSEVDLDHVNLGPPIFAFGSLWIAALDDNVVLRVDPRQAS